MTTGYAIHIGLDAVDRTKYCGWDGALGSAQRDAQSMAVITRTAGFSSHELLGANATSGNLVEHLRVASGNCIAGDFVVVSFAGHGGFMQDPTSESPSGLAKTWCLYDRQFFARELY